MVHFTSCDKREDLSHRLACSGVSRNQKNRDQRKLLNFVLDAAIDFSPVVVLKKKSTKMITHTTVEFLILS